MTHAVIYDTESPLVHERMLSAVLKSVPSLQKYKGPILTGRESVITKSLNDKFPNLFHVRDWEHLIVGSRLWLRSTGATVTQINSFTDHLRLLLDSPTKDHYQEKFIRCSEAWTAEFRDYYNEKLRSAVEERLGRWILQRYSLFSKQLGVMDLVSHGLQVVMRDMQDVKEPSVDTITLTLYHLSVRLTNEIAKAFCNFGTYRLRPELQYMLRGADEVLFIEKTFPPNTIVDALRANRLPIQASSSGSQADDMSQAARILAAGNVNHVAAMKAFLVKGVYDDLHAVKLYPREYCTCAPKDTCCHILAAKLSIGVAQATSKPKPAPCIIVKVAEPPAGTSQPQSADASTATQTIANLVASGAAGLSQNPGQQVFTLDSFIEALTVARECIVSPATSSVTSIVHGDQHIGS